LKIKKLFLVKNLLRLRKFRAKTLKVDWIPAYAGTVGKVNNKKYFLFLCSVLFVVALSLLTESCADDPSSLGLKFIPPGETTGVKIFDSFVDTMLITATSIKKRVNTYISPYMMVGNSGTYNSKAILKFNSFSSDFDSATVLSATLTLKYENYYYPYTNSDSLGQIGFDIYTVQKNLNPATITLDSVNSSSFGTVSQGNYTGFLTADSQEVTINLNTSMVKDWLEYAADTNYPNKNYGVVLSPNSGSNTIKGFYSTQSSLTTLKPSLQIILTKYGVTDTINTQDAGSVSLAEGTLPQGNETFSVQAGIGYIEVMKFDMSHIPGTATINDVLLFFTIDSANTKLSTLSGRSLDISYISDTTGGPVASGISYASSQSGNQYVIRVVDNRQPTPFQRWLDGTANYGLMISPRNYWSNLDLYTFFNMNSSDPLKRPHVVIKYTPRTTHK
jgi:hypothetical protein